MNHLRRLYTHKIPWPAAMIVVLILGRGVYLLADDWNILPRPKEKPGVIVTPPHKPQAAIEEVIPKLSKADLGRMLFNDPILSANGKVACATCHLESHGFASKGLPPKLGGGTLERDAPSLYNRGKATVFFWDGREASLEKQIDGPLFNKDEMGNRNWAEIMGRMADTDYPKQIKATVAYGFTPDAILEFIAEYERTIEHPNKRWDSYVEGRGDMTAAQKRGYDLFRGEAHCYKCHTGRFLTDDKFHNTGVGYTVVDKDVPLPIDDALFADQGYTAGLGRGYFKDWGRAYVTLTKKDMGKFKTPGLRGVKDTAPYMHDGSIDSLEKVIDFYDRGGVRNVILDPEIKPLRMSPRQKSDLLEFLRVL